MRSHTLLLVTLAVALGCGRSSPKQPESHSPDAVPAPSELPVYPGAIEAGVSSGPEPVEMEIALDPVDVVRAFYSKERLIGFEVLEGDFTTVRPLHVRDSVDHRDYFITVYEDNGVTMIRIATKALLIGSKS